MGACPRRHASGGCGRMHLPIDLSPDDFPADMPWQASAVGDLRGCPPGLPSCISLLAGSCSSVREEAGNEQHGSSCLQEVVVLPPGALEGRSAAQWRALLEQHAALASAEPSAPAAAATRQQQRRQQKGQPQPEGARVKEPSLEEMAGVAAAAQQVLRAGDKRSEGKARSSVIW